MKRQFYNSIEERMLDFLTRKLNHYKHMHSIGFNTPFDDDEAKESWKLYKELKLKGGMSV